MSAQNIKEGIQYALAFATGGAGASFGIKSFLPLPVIDIVPQAIIVKTMSHQLATLYGLTKLRGLTLFTGILVGAGSGMKMASEVATFIPIAGPGANAATTFSLHMSVGITLIIIFELLQEGAINEDYIRNIATSDVTFLLGLATQVLADIMRGQDGIETTQVAINKFKVPAQQV